MIIYRKRYLIIVIIFLFATITEWYLNGYMFDKSFDEIYLLKKYFDKFSINMIPYMFVSTLSYFIAGSSVVLMCLILGILYTYMSNKIYFYFCIWIFIVHNALGIILNDWGLLPRGPCLNEIVMIIIVPQILSFILLLTLGYISYKVGKSMSIFIKNKLSITTRSTP